MSITHLLVVLVKRRAEVVHVKPAELQRAFQRLQAVQNRDLVQRLAARCVTVRAERVLQVFEGAEGLLGAWSVGVGVGYEVWNRTARVVE